MPRDLSSHPTRACSWRLLADQVIGRDHGKRLGRQRDGIEVGGAAEVAGAVEDDLVGAVTAAGADAGVALGVRAGRIAGAGRWARWARRTVSHGRSLRRADGWRGPSS